MCRALDAVGQGAGDARKKALSFLKKRKKTFMR
jgi:hypothetical protein